MHESFRSGAAEAAGSAWVDYAGWRGAAGAATLGDLRVHPAVPGPDPGGPRHLLACLPPGYAGSDARYPVIYMHDGQNLFDAATSFAGSWDAAAAVGRLWEEGTGVIVVGVPNAGRRRLHEYGPFHDPKHGGGGGDAYLEFLAGTVKPLVDRSFRTRPEARATGLAGSSMGGLISLYGAFARPEVFGLAAALSPSLRLGADAIFPFIARCHGRPARVYLDAGTREAGHLPQSRLACLLKSRRYTGRVRRMRDLLVRRGFRAGGDLLFVEEAGGAHNEAAWARRLPGALRFLLAATRAPAG